MDRKIKIDISENNAFFLPNLFFATPPLVN